jgi:hypothetical protein
MPIQATLKTLALGAVVVVAATATISGVGASFALKFVGGYILGVLTGLAIKRSRMAS